MSWFKKDPPPERIPQNCWFCSKPLPDSPEFDTNIAGYKDTHDECEREMNDAKIRNNVELKEKADKSFASQKAWELENYHKWEIFNTVAIMQVPGGWVYRFTGKLFGDESVSWEYLFIPKP